MVEKDFWVSWTLAALFGHPEFGEHLVFKVALRYRKFLVFQ
jgi:predicted nucleotidyltransferase component of viral defense system